ncbi:hypothetical protein SISSUDRAFT_1067558 [Sistotremastrum suecicum HHB10207 ss-3]|uniref:Uncharacterized protein n=1 Tax=Sistotremastrum suecicum HHB10207 ss-3 TaxID=1314776 RepID=A0A165WZK0_9AGAM|nr:hypothetical protein SISSUDRAFT_1067558 [Sistotremastrum suecicum HHB10207 ss-3]
MPSPTLSPPSRKPPIYHTTILIAQIIPTCTTTSRRFLEYSRPDPGALQQQRRQAISPMKTRSMQRRDRWYRDCARVKTGKRAKGNGGNINTRRWSFTHSLDLPPSIRHRRSLIPSHPFVDHSSPPSRRRRRIRSQSIPMDFAFLVDLHAIHEANAFNAWLDHALFEVRQNWHLETNVWMADQGYPTFEWFPEGEPRSISLRKIRRFALRFNSARARRGRRKMAIWTETRWGTLAPMCMDFFEAYHGAVGIAVAHA